VIWKLGMARSISAEDRVKELLGLDAKDHAAVWVDTHGESVEVCLDSKCLAEPAFRLGIGKKDGFKVYAGDGDIATYDAELYESKVVAIFELARLMRRVRPQIIEILKDEGVICDA